MSIAVMGEGEVMGRGIPPNPDTEKYIREREMAKAVGMAAAPSDTVPIFGAGPAGLLAAHAVALAGREPIVFTLPDEHGQPIKSKIGAATYLHTAIPDVARAEPDGWVKFKKIGTAAGYALKLYGDRMAKTSWDSFEGEYPAWSLEVVYEGLWQRYFPKIIPVRVDAEMIREFVDTHAVVISSISPENYCDNPQHTFPRRPIWIIDQALESVGDNEILYDGTVGVVANRYRSSKLFGHGSTEYAEPVPTASKGFKVLRTDCNCQPDILRVGRFGEWKPGVLVHHAWTKTWNAMWDQFEGA